MRYLLILCAVLVGGWGYVLWESAPAAVATTEDSQTVNPAYAKDQTFTEQRAAAGSDVKGVEIVKWETIIVDAKPCERAANRPDYCGNTVLYPETERGPIVVGTPKADAAARREREKRRETRQIAQSRQATESDKDGTSIVACERAVEALARWDYEWTGGWLKDRFPLVSTSGEFLLLAGNSIKLQNGFGAWRRVGYVCMYDVVNETALAYVVDD